MFLVSYKRWRLLNYLNLQLDVDPRKDDDASPMSSYRLCWDLLERFQLFGTSQNSISIYFEKRIKFLGFHGVVLVKTFPLMYQLLM